MFIRNRFVVGAFVKIKGRSHSKRRKFHPGHWQDSPLIGQFRLARVWFVFLVSKLGFSLLPLFRDLRFVCHIGYLLCLFVTVSDWNFHSIKRAKRYVDKVNSFLFSYG